MGETPRAIALVAICILISITACRNIDTEPSVVPAIEPPSDVGFFLHRRAIEVGGDAPRPGLELRWHVRPVPESFEIEYSRDGGESWRPLAAPKASAAADPYLDGRFRWPLPPEPYGQHRLRFRVPGVARLPVEIPVWNAARIDGWWNAITGVAVPNAPVQEPREVIARAEAGTPSEAVVDGPEMPASEPAMDEPMTVVVDTAPAPPPTLILESAVADGGRLVVHWRTDDPDVTVELRVSPTTVPADLAKTVERVVPLTGHRHELALEAGEYRYQLVARDADGGETRVPLEPASIEIVARGPHPLNFSGTTLRGGAAHYLFIGGEAEDFTEGDVTVSLLPRDPSRETIQRQVPANQRSILWELPAVSGEYLVQLSWTGLDGKTQVSRAEEPFSIDADAPAIGWHEVPATVDERLVLEVRPREVVAGDEERAPAAGDVHRWDVWCRGGDTAARRSTEIWNPVAPHLVEVTRVEDRYRIEIDVREWVEGHWELGIEALDEVGNRSPMLADAVVRIDRTPPDLATLEVPTWVREGVPLEVTWSGSGDPPSLAVRYEGDFEGVESPLSWQRDGRRWRGRTLPLAGGRGDLVFSARDAAGNVAEMRRSVTVRPAVVSAELSPTSPLSPRSTVWLRYELATPHPLASVPLEARLTNERGEVGQIVDVALRKGRVRLTAPGADGRYRVELAVRDGVALGDPLEFEVRGPRNVTIEPARATTRDPDAAKADRYLLMFREFRHGWETGKRDPEDDRRRRRLLLDGLQGLLTDHPDWVHVRRALAQLHSFQEPPDLEAAARVLDGAPADSQGRAYAQLLNDRAAVALQAGELALAERVLKKAIAIEDHPRRRYNLAQTHMAQDRFADADLEFRRAIEGAPDVVEYHDAWVECVRLRGRSALKEAAHVVLQWKTDRVLTPNQAEVLSALLIR